MAIPALAVAAGQAAAQYGPVVYKTATDALRKATSGKLTELTPTAVATYVGGNSSRMQVVADAMIRSGVAAGDIFPEDIVGVNPQLKTMRDAAMALMARMRNQFESGSDRQLGGSVQDSVSDILRVKRVNAVLEVYGSAERYFLCHPNGGVPMADFAYVVAMKKALVGR